MFCLFFCLASSVNWSNCFLILCLCIHLCLQKLKSFFNVTWYKRYNEDIDPGVCTIVWSVAVSIFSVGGMVGSFSVGVIANRFGRYETFFILLCNIIGNMQDLFSFTIFSQKTF